MERGRVGSPNSLDRLNLRNEVISGRLDSIMGLSVGVVEQQPVRSRSSVIRLPRWAMSVLPSLASMALVTACSPSPIRTFENKNRAVPTSPANPTPESTPEPTATATPEPTTEPTPEPSTTPKPSTPEPPTPKPSITPIPSATPRPSITPRSSATTEDPVFTPPPELSPAHQLLAGSLDRLLNQDKESVTGSDGRGHSLSNPFYLDRSEVEQFKKTGNAEGFKSFQVATNSRNEPAFIIATNPNTGLNPEFAGLILSYVKRLNDIDPSIIDTLVKWGVRVVAGNTGIFDVNPDFISSFNYGLGAEYVNESRFTQASTEPYIMGILVGEGRQIYTRKNAGPRPVGKLYRLNTVPDKLDDNTGVDKGLYIIQWANKFRSKLSQRENDATVGLGKGAIERYTKNPV